MTLLLMLLFAPALLAGGAYTAYLLCRSLAFGAGLLIAVSVLGAITVTPLSVQAAGFHVYLEDLAGCGLAAAAALRLARAPEIRRRARPWYGFAAATALAFVLGAASHGLKAAGVEYRSFFYFCAATLYCGSFPLHRRQLKTIAMVWLAGSAALLALAGFRWSADLLQLGWTSHWEAVGSGQRMRVLNASHTFYLAQALLIAVYFRRRMPQWSGYAALLAGAVVLLQHRSVWVGLLVALAAVCRREGAYRHLATRSLVAAGLGAVVYLAAPQVFSRESVVADALATSIEEPFDLEHSTFVWRVSLWQAYLLEFLQAGPRQQITGMGFGNPSSYVVDAVVSADSAHNYYIFTLNRTGALGLATLLAAYWAMLRRFRHLRGGWSYAGLLYAIVVSQVVYCTVYSPSPDQGLLMGAALGIGSTMVRRRVVAAAAVGEAVPAEEARHAAARA